MMSDCGDRMFGMWEASQGAESGPNGPSNGKRLRGPEGAPGNSLGMKPWVYVARKEPCKRGTSE